MADNRTKIDELIEESYLATLSEEAIRQDLLQFIDMCDRLMKESHGEEHEITQQIDEFKSLALRVEQAAELADDQEAWAAWSGHDLLAHRAARLKLVVLDSVREVDPVLAEHVERERLPVRNTNRPTPKVAQLPKREVLPERLVPNRLPKGTQALIVRVLYALLAGTTLFLLGWRVIR